MFSPFFVVVVIAVVVVVQGDVEKDLGWKPIPLFDRSHREDIASMQVRKELVEVTFGRHCRGSSVGKAS